MKRLVLLLSITLSFSAFAITSETQSKPQAAIESLNQLNQVESNPQVEQKCDATNPDACLNSSVQKSRSENIKARDSKRKPRKLTRSQKIVRKLAERCKKGSISSCKRLADLADKNKRSKLSMKFLAKACSLQDANACRLIGRRLGAAGKIKLSTRFMAKATELENKKSRTQ